MSAPAIDEIEARLRALPASLTVNQTDAQAIARLASFTVKPQPAAFAVRARPRRRRIPWLVAVAVAALALLVIANSAAAYYAPSYGQALAQVPVVGGINAKLLDFYGVTTQNVTAVNDSSTSSGHTVHLVAAYADGLRIVVYLDVDGRGLTGNPKAFGRHEGDYGVGIEDGFSLTDQFGHSYKLAGPGGGNLFQFEPLVWPASKVGARLTLHISYLQRLWLEGDASQRTQRGDWTLHATLTAEPVHVLPVPAPLRTANAVYTFTSLRATPTAVRLTWTTTGPLIDDPRLTHHGTPAEAKLFQEYLLPRLFDEAGNQMPSGTIGVTFSRPVETEFNGFVHGPGRYRLQLGDALTDAGYEVWIVVP